MPPHASAEPALGKLGIAKLARIMQFPGERLLVFKQVQDLGTVVALNRIADEALASASKGGTQDCDTSSLTSNKTTLRLRFQVSCILPYLRKTSIYHHKKRQ